MSFLSGTIYLTDREDIVYNAPMNPIPGLGMGTIIVSLDEDDVLIKAANIIGGLCLLPPIPCKIAESDGNEQLYDTLYASHLMEPVQQEFMAALISVLYRGGNIIFFLPDLDYDYTKEKLIEHLFRTYGLHVGLINHPNPMVANCYYDEKCIPIWINLMYSVGSINGYDYLRIYPSDAIINNQAVINRLLDELNPYGNSIAEQQNYLIRLHQLLHKDPRIKMAVSNIRRSY